MLPRLLGKKILLTREKAPSMAMARDIQELGGEPVILPVMKIVPTHLSEEDNQALQMAEQYDWIIFTSSNGVKAFMANFESKRPNLSNVKITTVGKKTAQTVVEYGLTVEQIPNDFTAESLATLFKENEKSGSTALLPLGTLAKPYLEEELRKVGITPKRVNVYDTVENDELKAELIQLVNERAIDVVTFASPSSIKFFLSMTSGIDLSDFWKQTIVACIGRVSARFARERGLNPRVVPQIFTAHALIEAIAEFYHGANVSKTPNSRL